MKSFISLRKLKNMYAPNSRSLSRSGPISGERGRVIVLAETCSYLSVTTRWRETRRRRADADHGLGLRCVGGVARQDLAMELGAQESPAALQDGPLPLVVGPGEDDGIDVDCRRAAHGSSFDPRRRIAHPARAFAVYSADLLLEYGGVPFEVEENHVAAFEMQVQPFPANAGLCHEHHRIGPVPVEGRLQDPPGARRSAAGKLTSEASRSGRVILQDSLDAGAERDILVLACLFSIVILDGLEQASGGGDEGLISPGFALVFAEVLERLHEAARVVLLAVVQKGVQLLSEAVVELNIVEAAAQGT